MGWNGIVPCLALFQGCLKLQASQQSVTPYTSLISQTDCDYSSAGPRQTQSQKGEIQKLWSHLHVCQSVCIHYVCERFVCECEVILLHNLSARAASPLEEAYRGQINSITESCDVHVKKAQNTHIPLQRNRESYDYFPTVSNRLPSRQNAEQLSGHQSQCG